MCAGLLGIPLVHTNVREGWPSSCLAACEPTLLACTAPPVLPTAGILYSIYPPLFGALVVYSLGGTALSVYIGRPLVGLNFQQEAQEANFRWAGWRACACSCRLKYVLHLHAQAPAEVAV